MTIENFALATAVVSIVFALWLRRGVKKQSEGDEKMKEIAEAIREGSKAFLKRQFKSIFVVGVIIALALWWAFNLTVASGFWSTTENLQALIGLGFGGSLISVFSRLGGGIYTKAADVGADLVGKTETG